jgi:shikimate dehydrogenase
MSKIIAGVIGFPIAHSVSPHIHNYWLQKYNIEGEYHRFEVSPEALPAFISNMQQNGIFGVNITIPHKESAWDFLKAENKLIKCSDIKCKVAKIIGATNTLTALPNGKYQAANTDFIGFAENLQISAPEFDYKNAHALVLGAGGAAKAIIFALISILEVKSITLTNRTKEKCEEIKQIAEHHFDYRKIKIIDWEQREEALKETNLVVNTTSLGMKGKGELEFSLDNLQPKSLVTDIVYNPLETKLLKDANAKHAITVDGLGMLIHQAKPAFETWFGKKPEVTNELKELLIKQLGL